MKDEIKEILDKFDKVLVNYELDKKWEQMSVDSICHLFPNEMIIIKNHITNLQEENKRLKEEKSLIESDINNAYSWLENYKSRNEKAIEYCDREIGNIIANFDYVDTKDLQNVKNILNGGDNNEN